MKALVIGGVWGFGKEITQELKDKDFQVITVARSEEADYSCDVGDLKKWEIILKEIKGEHPNFDLVVFVVGYARAKISEDLSIEDWQEHINKKFWL